MPAIYRHIFTVPESVIDGNGHVNNVAYVQWMQDAAIKHTEAAGSAAIIEKTAFTWVAYSHRITYHRPCYLGEEITAFTWVSDFRSIRSLRRYKFVRESDNTTLASGETDWVFIDTKDGRPIPIPADVVACFSLVAKEDEP